MNLLAVRAKANAHYTCQKCGSTELIQAHHEIPGGDDSLIVLCAECHSKKHPNMPEALFFNKRNQPYWHNKSASSLAKELGVHPRTIIRAAKRLEILPGELSPWDEELIKNNTPKLQWEPKGKSVKKVRGAISKPTLETFKVREFQIENGKVVSIIIDYEGNNKSILEWYAPKSEIERLKNERATEDKSSIA